MMKEKRNKVNITRFKFIKQELQKFKKKSTETMANHVIKNSKMSKDREDLNCTVNQFDPVDIYEHSPVEYRIYVPFQCTRNSCQHPPYWAVMVRFCVSTVLGRGTWLFGQM